MIKDSKDKGFTLIELLVSSTLFIILMAIVVGIFIQTLRTQRNIVLLGESMDDASFIIERITREARVVTNFNSGNNIYSNSIAFVKSDGQPVSYKYITSPAGGGVGRCTSSCLSDSDYSLISSPEVNVERIAFILSGVNPGDGAPPRITILITVVSGNDIEVNLQSTVSGRAIGT